MKNNRTTQTPRLWTLDYYHVSGGTGQVHTATIRLKKGKKTVQDASVGANLIDAVIKAINRLIKARGELIYCSPNFTLPDQEGKSLFEASATVNFGDDCSFTGRNIGADIIEAIALAYLDSVNQRLLDRENKKSAGINAPV